MTFLWPALLWVPLLVPVLAVLYVLAQRRRQKFALKYSSLTLVKRALAQGPGFRRHVPAVLMLVALTLLGFGLSRPTAYVPLLSNGGLIVLVMDVSGSMRAQDVAPTRIEAAQAAAKAFIDKQPADARLALVTFAASAVLVQPPTSDKDALKAAIDRINLQRGTAIGSGIVTALDTILQNAGEPPLTPAGQSQPAPEADPNANDLSPFGGFGRGFPSNEPPPLPAVAGPPLEDSVMVLLSDGRTNVGPDPLDVVPLAVQRKIRIYTVGLGQVNGVVLEAFGRRARVTLDEVTLRAIADKTKADYFQTGTDTDLKSIYQNLSNHLVVKQEKVELTVFFAALAALVLLVAAGLSLFWFNRLT